MRNSAKHRESVSGSESPGSTKRDAKRERKTLAACGVDTGGDNHYEDAREKSKKSEAEIAKMA